MALSKNLCALSAPWLSVLLVQFDHFGVLAENMSRSGFRELIFTFFAGKRRIYAKVASETLFSLFWWAGKELNKTSLREFILRILVDWPRISAKVASEISFSVFWWAGRIYIAKQPQRCHFQKIGVLAENIRKSGIRELISAFW